MQGPIALIDPRTIDIAGRLRPADKAHVEALAASISETGLQTPITVRRDPGGGNRPILVAGLHRVSAVLLLGWTEIPAIWLEVSDREARLIEIDENLIRHELTALDRAIFLAERKDVYEALHPETAVGKAKKPKKDDARAIVANMATFARYSKDAANRTGLSERVVQRSVELARALNPATFDALRKSDIADNQAQLLALAALPHDQQLVCAQALATGARNVQAAQVATELAAPRVVDPEEAAFVRFVAMWERASAKLKKRIEKHIAPVPSAPKAKATAKKVAGGEPA